ALACIEIGFQKLKLQTIVGHVLKDNIASIKVLEKIGLHFFEERKQDGDEYNVYRIENNAK
ncbi:MAG: GNAT family protein, partial [Saprospiraceae bacterium]